MFSIHRCWCTTYLVHIYPIGNTTGILLLGRDERRPTLSIGTGPTLAGASIKGMPDYIKEVAQRDRNVAF